MQKVTLITLFIMGFFFNQSCQSEKEFTEFADRKRVNKNLLTVTRGFGNRDYLNLSALNKVADYIHNELSACCDTVKYQEFTVNSNTYKNVIASIGTEHKERIIIGAHYDVCGQQEGADDNASGLVGLLELARLLSKENLNYRIDFVAYTLEEPPFFKTEQMGSYIHAKSVFDEKQKIKGMICLEMIGYFNDSENSQKYPLSFLKLFYGNKGDFITVVEKFGSGSFSSKIRRLMKKPKLIKTKSFIGPKSIEGLDFSDHRNYWKFGYDALMITNTSFYRNPHYHQQSDKVETLDIERMCRVIDQVYLSVKEF